MKQCFKVSVLTKLGKTEIIPMRGKDEKDMLHKVEKLPTVAVILSSEECTFAEYEAIKEAKKPALVQPLTGPTVLKTELPEHAGERPFKDLELQES